MYVPQVAADTAVEAHRNQTGDWKLDGPMAAWSFLQAHRREMVYKCPDYIWNLIVHAQEHIGREMAEQMRPTQSDKFTADLKASIAETGKVGPFVVKKEAN